MTAPDSADEASIPDGHEQLIAEFVQRFDVVGEAAVDEYIRQYPELATRIHGIAKVQRAAPPPGQAAAPPRPPALANGSVVGDFRIRSIIRHGGMGEIYLAEQLSLGRRVALKVIGRDKCSQLLRERFEREQCVLAKLHETHIVPIYFGGNEGPLQYFVMPYIDGATAYDAIRAAQCVSTSGEKTTLRELARSVAAANTAPPTDPTHSWSRQSNGDQAAAPDGDSLEAKTEAAPPKSAAYFQSVAEFVAQVAESLDFAHGRNIFHRDIKPGNLMIEPNGKAWIIDFGLANDDETSDLSDSPGELEPNADSTRLSLGGGTPAYMSPERHELWNKRRGNGKPKANEPVTVEFERRSDVWSLGITLYELLTLQAAFQGDYGTIRTEVVSPAPILSPKEICREVPRDLAVICQRACAKDPQQRYDSAGAMAADLRRWLRNEPIQDAPITQRLWLWAQRNKGWAAFLVAVALFLIAFTTLAAVNARQSQRTAFVQQLRRIQSGPPPQGWSRDAWNKAADAAAMGRDDLLRGQVTSMLYGWDAVEMKRINYSAASLAFGPGNSLILSPIQARSADRFQLWTESTNEFRPIGEPGGVCAGILAATGDAIQVRPIDGGATDSDSDPPPTLEIWNLSLETKLARCEFKVQEGAWKLAKNELDFPLIVLSTDSTLAAATAIETARGERGLTAVWDTKSGELVFQVEVAATAIALSPDNQFLAVGNSIGRTSVWSLETGKKLCELSRDRLPVSCLAWRQRYRGDGVGADGENTLDGRLLASGDDSGVAIWDLASRIPLTYCRASRGATRAIAFSPDGMTLATCGRYAARLWSVVNGRLLLELENGNQQSAIAFSPDGRLLAVAAVDWFKFKGKPEYPGSVAIFALENGRGVRSLPTSASPIARVVASQDGNLLAVLSNDWRVAIWNLKENRLLRALEAPPGNTTDNAAIAFSPDQSQFAVASGDRATMWNLDRGTVVAQWKLPDGLGDAICWNDDTLRLYRSEPLANDPYDRIGRFRELMPDGSMQTFQETLDHNHRILDTFASPDGGSFVVFGLAKKDEQKHQVLCCYDAATGQEKWSEDDIAEKNSGTVSIDPTSSIVFANFKDKHFVFRLATGVEVGELKYGVSCLGPGGETALASFEDVGVRLYYPAENRLGVFFDFQRIPADAKMFSSDGQEVIWGSQDGIVYIADLPKIRERLESINLGW